MPQKKTTKQPSRFSRILTKLTPTTRKSQVVAFMAIFAVIGGGIYLYQSHAQVIWQVTKTYTAADNALQVVDTGWNRHIPAKRTSDPSVPAANKTVYTMTPEVVPNSSSGTSYASASLRIANVLFQTKDDNNHGMQTRACVWTNRPVVVGGAATPNGEVSGSYDPAFASVATDGAYTAYCALLYPPASNTDAPGHTITKDVVLATYEDSLGTQRGNDYGYTIWKVTIEREAATFNPSQATTRQTMASWLYVASFWPNVPTEVQKCGQGKPGPFKDVPGTHPFCKEIEWMRATGLTTGNADGTYGPLSPVTRQSAAAFLYRFAGNPDVPAAAESCGAGKTGPFSDVPSTHPFCKEITWMKATNLTTGYTDGSFRPADVVSRQAMASFLWRVKGQPQPPFGETAPIFTDIPTNHPFYSAIQWLGSGTCGWAGGDRC